MSDLHDRIIQLPRRREKISGQTFSYVKLDDVLALLKADDLLSSMGAQEKDSGAALLPVDPSAAVRTEPLPKTEHSNTCDLVGFRQGYNAPPVCSCGADKGHQ